MESKSNLLSSGYSTKHQRFNVCVEFIPHMRLTTKDLLYYCLSHEVKSCTVLVHRQHPVESHTHASPHEWSAPFSQGKFIPGGVSTSFPYPPLRKGMNLGAVVEGKTSKRGHQSKREARKGAHTDLFVCLMPFAASTFWGGRRSSLGRDFTFLANQISHWEGAGGGTETDRGTLGTMARPRRVGGPPTAKNVCILLLFFRISGPLLTINVLILAGEEKEASEASSSSWCRTRNECKWRRYGGREGGDELNVLPAIFLKDPRQRGGGGGGEKTCA